MGIQPASAYSALSFLASAMQQRQPSANATASPASSAASFADKVTISQAARELAAQATQENRIVPYADDPQAASRFMRHMAEKFAGLNQQRAMYANDPTNPEYAKWLDEAAQRNFSPGTDEGGLVDLSWGKSGADLHKMSDVIHYTGGEPVTAASEAYLHKQLGIYKDAATQLYASEKAKGTPAGEIWNKIMDLQEQQPARFRAMMGWPTAADFVSSPASAQPSSNPSLQFRAMALRDAQNDPVYAKKLAEQFAYNDSYEKHGPMVDITHDPIRYSATGEVVTEETLAAFKAEAAKVTAGRIALYQAEKAKGTPDAQILEKLFAFVDGQSDNYLRLLNWARPAQQSAG